MGFFTKRNTILLVILAAIVFGIGYYYSYRFLPTEFKDYDEWINERPRSLGEVIHYSEELEEAYRNDFYGGATPEETLALWVEAVKEDDLEKASLYFLVDYRKSALERMQESRRNNVLPEIIDDIENGGEASISSAGNRASFDTATAEERVSGNLGFNFRFVINPYTEVWKLEEF